MTFKNCFYRRLRPVFSLLLAVLVCKAIIGSQANAAEELQTAPLPDWVKVEEPQVPDTIPNNDISRGIYYLVSDAQMLAEENRDTVYFYHHAELIVNQEGLETAPQISISYDPAYEKLAVISVDVYRDGKKNSRLSSSKFSILQRETELESSILDGQLTASAGIDDIRVGDIISYSYTIEGDNPVYSNLFSYSRQFEWSVPVVFQRVNLLWKRNAELFSNIIDSDEQVEKSAIIGGNEYSLVIRNSKALISNSEAPNWYTPYGKLFFSEFDSWSKVVGWANPLYTNAIGQSPKIDGLAAEIIDRDLSIEEQVVAALEFVQSEIRYFGIELGENSHKPSVADVTLERRFGDCKDKTVLFISLLERLGIDAYPALVDTASNRKIQEYPPSPDSFNHVITQVLLKGPLSHIYQPHFGKALVIRSGETQLSDIAPRPNSSHADILTTFDMGEGANSGNDVKVSVKTDYRGYLAEYNRHLIDSSGLTEVQSNYLDFYQRIYGQADFDAPPQITDDTSTPNFTISESYVLNEFWDEEDDDFNGSFYADSIYAYLSAPDERKRNSPYALDFPASINQKLVAKFTGAWGFENETFEEKNPYFSLTRDITYDEDANILEIDYKYITNSDHVPAAETADYLDARKRARDALEYGITEYKKTSVSSSSDENSNAEDESVFSWWLAIMGLYIAGIIFIFGQWWLHSRSQKLFAEAYYYPVSLIKLFFLTIVTFTLYGVYWGYRNWKYVRDNQQSNIMPAARGFFHNLWYYPLYNNLVNDSEQRFGENRLLPQFVGIIFAILYFIVIAISDGIFLIASIVLTPVLLSPLANYINNLDGNAEALAYNSKFKLRHWLLGLIVLPLLALVLASDTNLIPADDVVKGNRIPEREITFLRRNNVIPATDEIQYFYSDGIFSMRSDGNGFTESTVFSYWKNEQGELKVASATFEEIANIEPKFSTDWSENSVISITRDDGSDFILLVSNTDKKDKVFFDALIKTWEAKRPTPSITEE